MGLTKHTARISAWRAKRCGEITLIRRRIVQVTPLAILVDTSGDPDHRIWLKRAEVAFERGEDGTLDTIVLPRYLAHLRGLIE